VFASANLRDQPLDLLLAACHRGAQVVDPLVHTISSAVDLLMHSAGRGVGSTGRRDQNDHAPGEGDGERRVPRLNRTVRSE
jgi:hypothetical protein